MTTSTTTSPATEIVTTYRIVTLSGRGLPTEVDADGYDSREAAEAMAEDCHDGEWTVREVQQDTSGRGFARASS
jgi:hypothetical protein